MKGTLFQIFPLYVLERVSLPLSISNYLFLHSLLLHSVIFFLFLLTIMLLFIIPLNEYLGIFDLCLCFLYKLFYQWVFVHWRQVLRIPVSFWILIHGTSTTHLFFIITIEKYLDTCGNENNLNFFKQHCKNFLNNILIFNLLSMNLLLLHNSHHFGHWLLNLLYLLHLQCCKITS